MRIRDTIVMSCLMISFRSVMMLVISFLYDDRVLYSQSSSWAKGLQEGVAALGLQVMLRMTLAMVKKKELDVSVTSISTT